MVVNKMMKWRPWPPLQSKKFEAKITVRELRGLTVPPDYSSSSKFSVEIKWKGSKAMGLGSLRRGVSVRRNFTKEESMREGDDGIGVVRWDEEFRCVCSFSAHKEGLFHPWEVSFTLLNGLKQVTGNASLNLSDFASAATEHTEINIPLQVSSTDSSNTSLYLSVVLLELKSVEEPSQPLPKPIMSSFPRSPCYGDMFSTEKDEEDISTQKRSPRRRASIFKGLPSLRTKRTNHEEGEECSDGRSSMTSEDSDLDYPLDAYSSEEVREDSRVRKSFDYGTLAYANHAGGSSIPSNTSSSEDEEWVHYSHRGDSTRASDPNNHPMVQQQNSKRRLLPWRKRKLSFRSSPKVKGEPLLKKYYGEEGGDDIDFDRRQISSSDESTLTKQNAGEDSIVNHPFGDDNFAVGMWQNKEITSRDGKMKLKTQVFFASIDQRSERAAGESACTALVAVIAHWLQSNDQEMPIKSQFDGLIREGSLEWRNLCENEAYRERFPDKHFDLETVLEAEIRPLCVVPEKSFVGFFHPQELVQDKGFDFLKDAMSFDDIWDGEISRCDSDIYIISWNDHFFILKVEKEAYYIIDTLGERLYEGCNQAFILKFDRDTTIYQNNDKPAGDNKAERKEEEKDDEEEELRVVCIGKESCKEYIKSFLATIPIRELQVDLKKGLMASTAPLHQRLQIEFHYARCLNHEHFKERSVPEEECDTEAATLQLEALESE